MSAATPKPLHGIIHHNNTGNATLVYARPQWLDPEKHRIAEEEFLALETACIIPFVAFGLKNAAQAFLRIKD